MKDEALSPVAFLMESLPIARPSDPVRCKTEKAVACLVEIAGKQQETRRTLLDWLRLQYGIEKPSLKLQSPIHLDSDAFVAEVAKVRGKKNPLTAAALKSLRDEHAQTIEPARKLAAEAMKLENEASSLVNEAYGLTPEEIALMWQTAPPRMPIRGPQPADASP